VETSSYAGCSTSAALGPTGLSIGGGPGQVSVTTASSNSYTIEAVATRLNGVSDVFAITKSTNGVIRRDCGLGSVGANRGTAGCNAQPDSGGNYW
jgi:hypothetical protein